MAIDKVWSKPMEAGLIPGVVAVAADHRGIIYQGAFGRRAVDQPEPMTLDSVFRIASMTKAGTAAMQLVEKGRIGLEQPMGDVLPVLKDVSAGGFDGDGTPQLSRSENSNAATCSLALQQLLNANLGKT
jgi:methyl acetate hydrolase